MTNARHADKEMTDADTGRSGLIKLCSAIEPIQQELIHRAPSVQLPLGARLPPYHQNHIPGPYEPAPLQGERVMELCYFLPDPDLALKCS
jgi:hypothetical protein